MKIEVKNFFSRADLERFITGNITGNTVKISEISGKKKELARFQLSNRTSIFGIKCVATDDLIEKKTQIERPQRGEIHKFGLNKNE